VASLLSALRITSATVATVTTLWLEQLRKGCNWNKLQAGHLTRDEHILYIGIGRMATRRLFSDIIACNLKSSVNKPKL
jgi:hypothetical protein